MNLNVRQRGRGVTREGTAWAFVTTHAGTTTNVKGDCMASTEEGLLTLLLSVEHLKNTAIEQQKAVADTLAVARETLRGYRDISDSVVKQVSDEVRKGYRKRTLRG